MPNFHDSPVEAAFRAEVKAFIESECPPLLKGGGASARATAGVPEYVEAMKLWRTRLATRGWIAPAWPKEYGGAGLTPIQQFIFNMETAEARVPPGGIGIAFGTAGPTIITHGSDYQKQKYLPGILAGEKVWCQMFSEPSAGSDLASLQTRATRDGDDFIINGQKIWTSGARSAQHAVLLARTNPDAPKHRGITFFLLDMDTPGINIRPLGQMNGNNHFNEVFLENVRIPRENVVGEVDRGWYVSTTTLDFERSAVGASVGRRQRVASLARVAREAGACDPNVPGKTVLRLEIADRMIEANVALMLSFRVADLQNRGRVPNYEASMAKLYSTELGQRIARTEIRVLGTYGVLLNDPRAIRNARYSLAYLSSVPDTIVGGTSEVQRNIISQRGLGLPRG